MICWLTHCKYVLTYSNIWQKIVHVINTMFIFTFYMLCFSILLFIIWHHILVNDITSRFTGTYCQTCYIFLQTIKTIWHETMPPHHGFCDPLRWWLAVWCRNSYLTRVLWLLHTWWFMVFAWSPKSSVPFSGYVNTEGGKRAQTFCVDDCCIWGHAQQGQFWFSPELEFIIGCFLPIPFFPSLPSFFFQRRFPCLLMQHPSKPSWHPQPVCTQWYSPTITGQLCAWNSVSFGSILSEAEVVLCVESLEKTFCSLE